MIVAGSVVLGSMGLLGIKKYMSGTQCNIVKDLSGKVAIVTGGNSGIGRETVAVLARMGCKVIFGARDQEKNEAVIK